MKLLKRQAADVDTLVGAMSKQLADLVSSYRESLESVERALLQVSYPYQALAVVRTAALSWVDW